eukprot:scaffold1116_cov103-Isochrysis_galbana.AAC.1
MHPKKDRNRRRSAVGASTAGRACSTAGGGAPPVTGRHGDQGDVRVNGTNPLARFLYLVAVLLMAGEETLAQRLQVDAERLARLDRPHSPHPGRVERGSGPLGLGARAERQQRDGVRAGQQGERGEVPKGHVGHHAYFELAAGALHADCLVPVLGGERHDRLPALWPVASTCPSDEQAPSVPMATLTPACIIFWTGITPDPSRALESGLCTQLAPACRGERWGGLRVGGEDGGEDLTSADAPRRLGGGGAQGGRQRKGPDLRHDGVLFIVEPDGVGAGGAASGQETCLVQ